MSFQVFLEAKLEFGLQAKQSVLWAACGTLSNKPKYSILMFVCLQGDVNSVNT